MCIRDRYITQIARDSITGYSSVIVRNNSISMNGRGSEYALLPVWMLNFRYNNKEFHFYLNGQTVTVDTFGVDYAEPETL